MLKKHSVYFVAQRVSGVIGSLLRKPCPRKNIYKCLNTHQLVEMIGCFLLICQGKIRSQWPRVLRRRFAAARLLRSWVRIPPGAWMFVCCECCVLSGRGLCDELITRPEESYRMCCVVVCLLYSGYRVFSGGVNRPGRGVDHPPHLTPKLKKE